MQAGYPEVVSSEIANQGADGVMLPGRPHCGARKRERDAGPAESKTPSMHRNSMRENREAPRPSVVSRTRTAWEKAKSYETQMNGSGESYSGIVPAKRSNESQGGPKEIVEGRRLTKENMEKPNSNRTPSREKEQNGLDGVGQTAKEDKGVRFRALRHHVTQEPIRR